MPRIRMSDPVSRYELGSKLAAQDARLDSAMHQMLGIVERMDRVCNEIRADNKDMKKTMIATGIAVVIGVAAFNSSVCSNILTAFQAGLNAQHPNKTEAPTPPSPSILPPGPFLANPAK
ncbi:hypothetical protein [Bordetella sp. LUAb4]|uniref:hypothetical protein n=1 Tax=Bordetella sp. LUAb4 TaxID=2843195 RepID=UPI001E424A99|nr:hypothetical protein [Bordetella sp. LUAb4]